MPIEDTIRDAIIGKRMVEFDYDGFHRIAEIHIYGVKNGVTQILVYQTAGESRSGGLPQWRRMDVLGITNMQMQTTTFPGRRPFPSGEHSPWDVTYLIVDL